MKRNQVAVIVGFVGTDNVNTQVNVMEAKNGAICLIVLSQQHISNKQMIGGKMKKEIEEIAQCKNTFGFICADCEFKNACDRYILAAELYEQGYRKIPENAVVLTKEEYKQIYNDERASYYRAESLFIENDFLHRKLVQSRKETAREIFELLKSKLFDLGNVVTEIDLEDILKEYLR